MTEIVFFDNVNELGVLHDDGITCFVWAWS